MGLPSRLGCVCIFQCARNSFYSRKKQKEKKVTVSEEEKITMKIDLSQQSNRYKL